MPSFAIFCGCPKLSRLKYRAPKTLMRYLHNRQICDAARKRLYTILLRKEVIHPQVLLRMPCYDLVPVIEPALEPLTGASGIPNSLDLTGGEYKTRERIHPGVADPGLLAIPSSWGRVADPNLN